MKKRIAKALMLLFILCVGISGCGKAELFKETVQEKNVPKENARKKNAQKKITGNQKSETRQIKKTHWIIELDPGHGGNDSGATGTNSGLQEKDINLKIAKYIKRELSKESKIEVYMTRDRDTKPGLNERVSKAAKDNADLFISLHNNAKGEIVNYDHGSTVIVPTGNADKVVSNQAQLLGCYILKQLEQTGLTNQGLLMRTSERHQTYSNGKLKDYYAVIHQSLEQGIPGVIVEHAFVDHKGDAKQFLDSDAKIARLAKADAKAIRNYCLGTVKQEKKERQNVTLVTSPKSEDNQYSKKTFVLYESK